MALETANSRSFIKEMFKEIEDVYLMDDIKNEENTKFVFLSYRYIEENNIIPGTKVHSWKTFPCILVGETVGKNFKKGVEYGNKIRYKELPSKQLKYLNKDTIVFKFPDRIYDALIVNDSLKTLIK